MRHQLTATFIATALLGLCACGGGDNNTPPLTGGIRVANGITDSTGLDMAISNVTSFSAIAIDSASAINYIPVSAVVSYKATLTSNGSSFTLGGISADQDKVTTIFTFGEMGSGTQGRAACTPNPRTDRSGFPCSRQRRRRGPFRTAGQYPDGGRAGGTHR